MSTKKILSTVVATALTGSSLLPSITHAKIDFGGAQVKSATSTAYDYEDSPYFSTKKVKKFLSWEQKVLDFMTKDYNKTIIKLKNANAKKAYAEEYIAITDNIKKVFSNAKYGSDYMFPTYIDTLKSEINVYKDLRKELVSLNGSSLNPFSIPLEEQTSVENDMIDFQKTVTVEMKKAIDEYDSSDVKETGKMDISTEGSFGKIDISVEKYTKLLSILTLSQEASVAAKAKFTLNMPGSYKYNKTTKKYEKTAGKTITGDASIDATAKIIDKDIYLTLNDYTLNTNLTGTEKEELDKSLKELTQYKGKTIKIPTSSSLRNTESLNQAEILAQFKKVLDILEQKSLLTPYKKLGDAYTITLKDETVQAIGNVYGQKLDTKDIKQAKNAMKKNPLFYSVGTDGAKTLFVRVNEKGNKGTVSLAKKNGEYSFLVDVKSTKNTTDSVYVLVKKDFVDAKILSSEGKLTVSYKDKTLALNGEAAGQTLEITGALSDENTNLNFMLNAKKIGNITWKKVKDTYSYDILFETTITEVLNKFHMSGESTVTKGTFPIVAPKNFIEKKSSSYSGDDTTLPSDFSDFE